MCRYYIRIPIWNLEQVYNYVRMNGAHVRSLPYIGIRGTRDFVVPPAYSCYAYLRRELGNSLTDSKYLLNFISRAVDTAGRCAAAGKRVHGKKVFLSDFLSTFISIHLYLPTIDARRRGLL